MQGGLGAAHHSDQRAAAGMYRVAARDSRQRLRKADSTAHERAKNLFLKRAKNLFLITRAKNLAPLAT